MKVKTVKRGQWSEAHIYLERYKSLPSNQRTRSNLENVAPIVQKSGLENIAFTSQTLGDRHINDEHFRMSMRSTLYLSFAQGSPADAQGPRVTTKPEPLSLADASRFLHASQAGRPPSFTPACFSGAGRSPWCGIRCPAQSPARSYRAMPC